MVFVHNPNEYGILPPEFSTRDTKNGVTNVGHAVFIYFFAGKTSSLHLPYGDPPRGVPSFVDLRELVAELQRFEVHVI